MSGHKPDFAETCPDCGGQWSAPMREGCKRPWHHADQWADVILLPDGSDQ